MQDCRLKKEVVLLAAVIFLEISQVRQPQVLPLLKSDIQQIQQHGYFVISREQSEYALTVSTVLKSIQLTSALLRSGSSPTGEYRLREQLHTHSKPTNDTTVDIHQTIEVGKTVVHWAWIPAILYFGLQSTSPRPSIIR